MNEPIQLCTQMILPENLMDDANFDFGTGGVDVNGKDILWKPGQIITISFIGGTQAARSLTREYAKRWQKYANIEFLWLDDRYQYQTMIRVGFYPERGTWSFVGTDALMIIAPEPTLNLGRLQDSMERGNMDDAHYVIMHEFAHMLGMQHEQHHPQNPIPWDMEALYAYHSNWTREQVDNAYYKLKPHPAQTPYDKHSIMHYPIDNKFTIGDFEVGYNYHPSEGDQEFMRRAYPGA